MNTTRHSTTETRISAALAHSQPSTRLQAALAAGSNPEPEFVEQLVERCAIEPDFFVRDMLTWALTRQPREITVPRLIAELRSELAQARSQALHSLSKIGDQGSFAAISSDLMHDSDDEVARSAWRAAVALVPRGREAALAAELATELGRGDRDTQLSLSRALIALGETVPSILNAAAAHHNPRVRAHAIATERLLRDPDGEFAVAIKHATRIAIGPPPVGDAGC
ncbi:HEAT repeat domain-containing protein [Hoyosella sp. YIM 151337]|uniref:HEAT repeat domain-containing protein n=1 Tax=Hoyosella sp. YIM 151337 TaxID=2992742 RepID=UPI0022362E00|nr:HEAT repeat domain-containing protein [Hoyosella sp. YIM 151337]MCW4354041.1 HEAT repeat domain-containing protein [Hoyosella sp. YIM 151337]